MARLSLEQARELFKASTGGKGSKISVPPGTLERIQGVNPPAKQEGAPKRGKMGNIKVPDPEGGQPFDSKAELKDWLMLRSRVRAGEIITVGRQPPFLLPGGIIYSPDFIIVHLDYSLEAWDTKGYATQVFINKRKQFEELYPHIKLTIHHTGTKRKPRKK